MKYFRPKLSMLRDLRESLEGILSSLDKVVQYKQTDRQTDTVTP